MIRFDNSNTYLVTGASSGIGKEIALLLNKLGANVVATARNRTRLEELKEVCDYSNNMNIEVYDLVNELENLPSYITNLKEKYGKFSGLVCSAGIENIDITRTLELGAMENIFKINYFAPMLLTKCFVDKRNCIGEGTSIVYISSIAGINPERGQISYSGSKGALIASMKSISKELSLRKIRCNCISPAWINTPLLKKHNDIAKVNLDAYSLGIGEAFDVANLAIFLLSDKARWITGQNYVLDGGSQ